MRRKNLVILNLFGTPCLTNGDGEILYLRNKKEIALLVCLYLSPERRLARSELQNILWGSAPRENSQTSLRQALRNIRRIESEYGVSIIEIKRATIELVRSKVVSDLESAITALRRATKHGIAKVQRLTSQEFLSGFDRLDPEFRRWRVQKWRDTAKIILQTARASLASLSVDASEVGNSLAGIIAKLSGEDGEKTDLIATEFHKKHDLGQILKTSRAGHLHPVAGSSPIGGVSQIFPTVSIQRPNTSFGDLASSVSLLCDRIERCRELSIVSRVRRDITDNASNDLLLAKTEHGAGFIIEIDQFSQNNAVSFILRDQSNGNEVHYDIIERQESSEKSVSLEKIERSVTRMEKKLRDYYQRSSFHSNSLYKSLSRVFDLSAKFDRRANKESLVILDSIRAQNSDCSLVYALSSANLLKRRLFMEVSPKSENLLQEARSYAEQAVALDPWHAFGQRMMGFALQFCGDFQAGKEHLLAAQSLSPFDASQAIATAEGCAFAGDIENAIQYADRASNSEGTYPRYFYGYLAHIEFAIGNFEKAAEYSRQAPLENMDYRAIRIAALWQLGRKQEACDELTSSLRRLKNQGVADDNVEYDTMCAWVFDLNPYADPRVSNLYNTALRETAEMAVRA